MHPTIDKEYYLSAQTGDFVCTTCGKSFDSREAWEKERAAIMQKK